MPVESYPARLRARIESREARLNTLGYRSYDAYLKSADWAKVKANFRKLVIEECGLCGSEEGLDLHHMTYERVGEESPFDLTWLCRKCHSMVHALEMRGEMGLDFAGLTDMKRAAQYAVVTAARKQERDADIKEASEQPERHKRVVKSGTRKIFTLIADMPLERRIPMYHWIGDVCKHVDKARSEGRDPIAALEDAPPHPVFT